MQRGGSVELVGNVHFDKIGSLLDVPTTLITLTDDDIKHFKDKLSYGVYPAEPAQTVRRSYRLPNPRQCI